MRNTIKSFGLSLLFIAAGSLPAFSAAIIEYEVTDLGDTTPGQDRWEYRYFVSGFTFSANQDFTIWFNPNSAMQLEQPSPPNADWDVMVLQPDLVLPDRGAFDALALVGTPSLEQPFVVDFVSLVGIPGAQAFDINEFDSQGNLVRVIESGFTVPAGIPEPGTFWLIAAAGIYFAVLEYSAFFKRSSRLGEFGVTNPATANPETVSRPAVSLLRSPQSRFNNS